MRKSLLFAVLTLASFSNLPAATTPGVNGSIPGYDWTLRTTSPVTDHAWTAVTYGTVSGNPLFVALGSAGLGMTSPDGVAWTSFTPPTSHTWSGVTFNGSNQFVAVGAADNPTGNAAMYSADGVTWTAATTPVIPAAGTDPATPVTYDSVAYGNGSGSAGAYAYVAVSASANGLVTADYRVMTSPDGITWTPRTAPTNDHWVSVAFGAGRFVAVTGGGGGQQVMTSDNNGVTWSLRSTPGDRTWKSVTYGNGRFVAVANDGTGQRVMTSDDGATWTLRNTPADNSWYSVTYGNGLFVAVAINGTDRVMTSPDGITWTARSAAANQAWFATTYGDGRFVAVSASGAGTRAMSSGGPCGDGLAYTTNQWLMLGVPCRPTDNTVAGAFGNSPTANFDSGAYDVNFPATGWVMYDRSVAPTPQYNKLLSSDDFLLGDGLWLRSGTAPVGDRVTVTSGTPWPVQTTNGCQSANGCVVIQVQTVSGSNRYNLVGNPFPYPVDWSQVRVRVNTNNIYTPSQAAGIGVGAADPPVMSNQIWIWNGNTYQSWSDTDPDKGNLKYFQSFWVNVLPGAAGQTVELLIPAEVSTLGQVLPLADPLFAALRAGASHLFDWLIPTAHAAEPAVGRGEDLEPGRAPGPEGGHHPAPGAAVADPTLELLVTQGIWSEGLEPEAALAAAHETARAEGREWWVRLKLDQPATGFHDYTNTLGQLLSAQDGYDPADLVELPPFAAPYLTLDFPHPEWGARAGRYGSDLRSAQRLNHRGKPVAGLPAGDWTFEIRADQPGGELVLTWEAPPEILVRSLLIDQGTGKTIRPGARAYRDGYRLTLTGTSRTLVWRFLGNGPN